jgi:ribose transport system substrate-binding protein
MLVTKPILTKFFKPISIFSNTIGLLIIFLLWVVAAPNIFADDLPAYLVPARKGPFVVGLSNSFSGNSWRAQMVAEFKAAAEKLKSDGTLRDYIVADATGNTSSQIQQIKNFIDRKVDAILIDANSDTALNPAIAEAHNKGILVISFDSVVNSPNSIIVNVDQKEFGRVMADWLVRKLNGEGDIIVLNGLQGTPVNNDRWSAAEAIFTKYPKIKVLTSVNANWDQAAAQQAVANILPSMPKIDGVWSQGGAMTLGAVYAFQAANRNLVPMTGEANNGFLKVWQQNKDKGLDSIAPSDPPTLSVQSLQLAVKALGGEKVEKDNIAPPLVITGDDLSKYVQPNMPDSMWLPCDLSQADLQKLFGTK